MLTHMLFVFAVQVPAGVYFTAAVARDPLGYMRSVRQEHASLGCRFLSPCRSNCHCLCSWACGGSSHRCGPEKILEQSFVAVVPRDGCRSCLLVPHSEIGWLSSAVRGLGTGRNLQGGLSAEAASLAIDSAVASGDAGVILGMLNSLTSVEVDAHIHLSSCFKLCYCDMHVALTGT